MAEFFLIGMRPCAWRPEDTASVQEVPTAARACPEDALGSFGNGQRGTRSLVQKFREEKNEPTEIFKMRFGLRFLLKQKKKMRFEFWKKDLMMDI
jgi:hypothetical protein